MTAEKEREQRQTLANERRVTKAADWRRSLRAAMGAGPGGGATGHQDADGRFDSLHHDHFTRVC